MAEIHQMGSLLLSVGKEKKNALQMEKQSETVTIDWHHLQVYFCLIWIENEYAVNILTAV